MFLAITPNPALDRVLIVPGFRKNEINRVQAVQETAGGKGLNVVRAARTLGASVRAIAPLAGSVGRRVADLADAEGIDAHWLWLSAGETRTCSLVTDPEAADTLILNERGPHVSADDWAAFRALVLAEAPSAALATCSGSLPPAVAPEALAELLQALTARGTPVMLDTSGASLIAALRLPLALLKGNRDELAEATGTPITDLASALAVARNVVAHGPSALMLTLGAEGALLFTQAGAWHARPPLVDVVTDVGSGDSTLAGFAAATMRGTAPAEALRLAVACGTANTLVPGPASFDPAIAEALARDVTIHEIAADI